MTWPARQSSSADADSVRPNSRTGGGYSLRRGLREQGLMDELQIDWHVNNVASMLLIMPTLDITQYKAQRT